MNNLSAEHWHKLARERAARIEELEAEIVRLRRLNDGTEAAEEIARLKALLQPDLRFPREWGLAPREARFLSAIAVRGEISTEAAAFATVKNKTSDEIDTTALLRVVVACLRPKLKPLGIKIGTAWGQGYYLVGQSREIIKGALRVAGDVENNEQTRERTAQDENLSEH
jgi:DNA-binding response OmpR family regulator